MSLSTGSSSSGEHYSSSRDYRRQPTGYFAHPPPPDLGEFSSRSSARDGVNNKSGSISMQNGAINLHIPCAFSYAYDVPVPDRSAQKKKTQPKPNVSRTGMNKYPLRQQKSSSVPKESRPFQSTVKSGQLYKASHVPSAYSSSKTANKTSVVWDFHAGERVPFQAVDYGKELYEQAAQNLARSLHQQKLAEAKSSSEDIEDNCFDFSKPGINSSRKREKALEKAVESLKNLPEEVEDLLRKDKRFEPVVMAKATKALNVPRNQKVYKDLVPVDPATNVRTEVESTILEEIRKSIQSVKQPSRVKDPEPKLEDFQTNSYTRIRPATVPSPPKPSSGISIEMSHDFDTIETEKQLENDSNKQSS